MWCNCCITLKADTHPFFKLATHIFSPHTHTWNMCDTMQNAPTLIPLTRHKKRTHRCAKLHKRRRSQPWSDSWGDFYARFYYNIYFMSRCPVQPFVSLPRTFVLLYCCLSRTWGSVFMREVRLCIVHVKINYLIRINWIFQRIDQTMEKKNSKLKLIRLILFFRNKSFDMLSVGLGS